MVSTTSAWSPFRIPVFRMLWVATLVSNIGTWMHDIGASWLMTTLSPTPVMVALVQTATTLPIFLLAMPAGALADIVDRRSYLIVVQLWLALVAGLLGFMTLTGITSAWSLIALTFAMGIGSAMMMPAWAAITPELVPRNELQSAIVLNSLGINAARTIGPALAGIIVSYAGTGAVFVLNALTYCLVIFALVLWRREAPINELPSERFFSALRSGFRFTRHAPDLQAAIIRGFGFFLFASASWALLPLLVKHLENSGPQTFGILVASMGAGAIVGALLLPRLREKISRDMLVALATIAYAFAMFALAIAEQLIFLCLAMGVSGIAWIAVLSSLQVAAQMALPSWVRSRGLAVFMATFMGAMATGSLLWGKIAEMTSISDALITAAVGAVITVLLTWRWHIGGIEKVDLTPSMHWPTPMVHDSVTHDRGPVLITIQYAVQSDKKNKFLTIIRELSKRRRRDGAFAWGVFEHTEKPNHFIESFSVDSWLEHLRQHERVTHADRILQAELRTLLINGSEPIVTHYVAPKYTAEQTKR
ncbi:Predicted arabinose efflux permease, MFS family [Nitrosomonas ureae]|uniref:Predicted arabinose efflux permease, MFS family n=1 Tax=Nitrosomonas ureae TaxID=44577 RepID=A0A285BU05_9PROT|nr:MFS transporter [Nitrosomonas ureae]SNX58787.1 Predicted arabinose efflux permease, MFS family [Nitrosomonas ureae]